MIVRFFGIEIWLVLYSVVGKCSVARNLLEWRFHDSLQALYHLTNYPYTWTPHLDKLINHGQNDGGTLPGKKGPNPTLHQFDIATLCSDDLIFECCMIALEIGGLLSRWVFFRCYIAGGTTTVGNFQATRLVFMKWIAMWRWSGNRHSWDPKTLKNGNCVLTLIGR